MQINPDSGLKNIEYLQAKSVEDWNQLFVRRSGWTGADGIYSIPISGKETSSEYSNEKTILLFSDTFISEVDNYNRRHNNIMVNNSYAVMFGHKSDPEQITFHWRTNEDNQPDAVFSPDLGYANPGDWFWLMDGISIRENIYIFALRLEDDPNHIFNFKIMGVSLITTSLGKDGKFESYTQINTPLFISSQNKMQDIVFGQAIMPLTEKSCNPAQDGYIYVYGPRGSLMDKELVVARVRPENFPDITCWSFWNGEGWSSNIADCFPVTGGISQEFSLNPLDNGQFILVFQKGNKVGIRFGESPVGPFGDIQYIWDCHEADNDPDIFVYNAKAHSHLSRPGELLISYNVNCHTLERHDIEADIYRPHFISLKLVSGD